MPKIIDNNILYDFKIALLFKYIKLSTMTGDVVVIIEITTSLNRTDLPNDKIT